VKREPKWKRITAQRALYLLCEIERSRLDATTNDDRGRRLVCALREVVGALDSHVRSELVRRRRHG
jgi:hypothetical protein